MHRLKVFGMMSIAVLCTACSTTKTFSTDEGLRQDRKVVDQRPITTLTQSQNAGDGVFLGLKCRLFKRETRTESDTAKLDLLRTPSKCRLRFVGFHWPTF